MLQDGALEVLLVGLCVRLKPAHLHILEDCQKVLFQLVVRKMFCGLIACLPRRALRAPWPEGCLEGRGRRCGILRRWKKRGALSYGFSLKAACVHKYVILAVLGKVHEVLVMIKSSTDSGGCWNRAYGSYSFACGNWRASLTPLVFPVRTGYSQRQMIPVHL